MTPLLPIIASAIRARGPLTVAAVMDIALYHPEHGYYASAARRSGREGDFFTSVDVGPLFGRLLAAQIVEMASAVHDAGASRFHLVEAGAGDGRLARDMLDGIAAISPDLYGRLRLTLVERSAAARARQPDVLSAHLGNVAFECTDALPPGITGAIVANELLDALPVHVVEMTSRGLEEVHVGERGGSLREVLLPATDGRIRELLDDLGAAIPRGVRVEVGLAAVDWIAGAGRAVDRGFLLAIDYGSEAADLFTRRRAGGTLNACRGHVLDPGGWLHAPGAVDLTAHVNLTAVRRAAARAGWRALGLVDQTYFLTALGLTDLLDAGQGVASIRRRLAARTLVQPGGLGSTMKVMAFGKQVGAPRLAGFAAGRVTPS